MSEWQPAKLIFAHGTGDLNAQQIGLIKGHAVRVKPLGTSVNEVYGCPPGSKMYQVHPDDAARIWPKRNPKKIAMACEHEILTD
jgi:hypothetical protein